MAIAPAEAGSRHEQRRQCAARHRQGPGKPGTT